MLIQYFFAVSFVGAIVLTWRRERQGAITRLEALLWSVLWAGGAVVAVRPEVTSLLARLTGVGRGVDLVLYVSIALLFWLAFKVLVRLERMERDITTLTRALALREGDAADGSGVADDGDKKQ